MSCSSSEQRKPEDPSSSDVEDVTDKFQKLTVDSSSQDNSTEVENVRFKKTAGQKDEKTDLKTPAEIAKTTSIQQDDNITEDSGLNANEQSKIQSSKMSASTSTGTSGNPVQPQSDLEKTNIGSAKERAQIHKLCSQTTEGKSSDDVAEYQDEKMLVHMKFEIPIKAGGKKEEMSYSKFLDIDAYTWKYLCFNKACWNKIDAEMSKHLANISNITEPDENDIRVTIERTVPLEAKDKDKWVTDITETFNRYKVLQRKILLFPDMTKKGLADKFMVEPLFGLQCKPFFLKDDTVLLISDGANLKKALTIVESELNGFVVRDDFVQNKKGNDKESLTFPTGGCETKLTSDRQEERVVSKMDESIPEDLLHMLLILQEHDYQLCMKDEKINDVFSSSKSSSRSKFGQRFLVCEILQSKSGDLRHQICKTLGKEKNAYSHYEVDSSSPTTTKLQLNDGIADHWIQSENLQKVILKRLFQEGIPCDVKLNGELVIWFRTNEEVDKAKLIVTESLKYRQFPKNRAKEDTMKSLQKCFEGDPEGLVKVSLVKDQVIVSYHQSKEEDIEKKFQELVEEYFIVEDELLLPDDIVDFCIRFEDEILEIKDVEILVCCSEKSSRLKPARNKSNPGFYFWGSKKNVKEAKAHLMEMYVRKDFPLEDDQLVVLKQSDGITFVKKMERHHACKVDVIDSIDSTLHDMQTSGHQELKVLETKQTHLSVVTGTLEDWETDMVLFPLVDCQNEVKLSQTLQKYGIELPKKQSNLLRNLTFDGVTTHTSTLSNVGGRKYRVTFIALPNLDHLRINEQKTELDIRNVISMQRKEGTTSHLILFQDVVTLLGERGISSVFQEIKNISQMNTDSSYRIRLLVEDMETACLMRNCARKEFGIREKTEMRIQIAHGALTNMKADVLVNSASKTLNLTQGQVSKAILQAAGEDMQVECNERYPNGIQIGEIAETDPGQMKDRCKIVYHGLLRKFDKKEHARAQVFFKELQMFVISCLQKACKAGHASIAFPALGTGILEYPVDAVAQIMVQAVEEFKKRTPESSLEEVIFVVYKLEDYKFFLGEYDLRYLQTPKGELRCVTKITTPKHLLQIAQGFFNDVKSEEVLVCLEHSQVNGFLGKLSLPDDVRKKAESDLKSSKNTLLRGAFSKISQLKLFIMKDKLPDGLKKILKCDGISSRHIVAMSQTVVTTLANYIIDSKKLPEMLQVVSIYAPSKEIVIKIASSSPKSPETSIGVWWQSLIPKADTAFTSQSSGVGAFRITARTMEAMEAAFKKIMNYIGDKEKKTSAYISKEEGDAVIIEASDFDDQLAVKAQNRNECKESTRWSFLSNTSMPQENLKLKLVQQGIRFHTLFPNPNEDDSFVVEVLDEDFGKFWNSYEKKLSGVSKLMLMQCTLEVSEEFNPYLAEGQFLEKTGLTGQSDAGLAFIKGKWIQILAAVKYFESRSSGAPVEQETLPMNVKSNTKPFIISPTLMTQQEYDREHFEAAACFFKKKLARDCQVEQKDGKVFVSFFDTEHAQQTKRDIEALNIENVDVLMTEESEIKNFTKELMKEHKRVFVQLKSDRKSIAVISNEWNDMAEVKKKILQKYGVVKSKTRRNRNFKSDAMTTEEVKPEALKSAHEYYQDGKGKNEKQSTPSDSQNTFNVGCLEVKVYQTDMTKLPIDAIVNAANGNLSHGSGVARAISKAAGQKLENEGRRYVHQNGKIPVTGIIPTTAGDMPCKMVLHAVGPAWSDYKQSEKQQCIEDLCKTIMRCLIVANKELAESIAIPAISSGLFEVPVDQCCQAYVRGTRLFAESVVGKIHLKEVHFVDVKADMVDNMKNAFSTLRTLPLNATREEEKFLKLNMPTLSPKQGLSSQSHPKQEKSLEITNTRFQRHTYRVGKEGTVKLYPLDLEKASTDAIICWNDSQMGPLTSASKAVKSAAGSLKINKKAHEIHFLDALLGDSGNLDVKCLIHCIVPVHTLNIRDLEKLLKAAINTVTYNQLDSLSLACFTNATVGHKEFCEALCVALRDCLDSDGKVPEVHVVDADASVVSTMKNVFDEKLRFEMSEDIKDASAALKEAEESDKCPICMDAITNPKCLKCGHIFCTHCIDHHFEVNKPDCPSCGTVHGKVYGNMPAGKMNVVKRYGSLPGYTGDRFEITYTFDSGYQGSQHPNEGKYYWGIRRTAYLPNNTEGKTVLHLLKVAFHRRLTFTIGRSTTTGKEGVITWNDIHHKTSDKYGESFGYPDPGYFDRVKGELKAKGITEDDIDKNEPLEGTIFTWK